LQLQIGESSNRMLSESIGTSLTRRGKLAATSPATHPAERISDQRLYARLDLVFRGSALL
jgi:hypothetical protein